jgi:hypothetical protein
LTKYDGKEHTLLIIDNMMTESGESISNIFTKLSHHRDILVLFLTQNLFQKSQHSRTMNINLSYLILFKNPQDSLQVATLAKQMYPGKSKFLIEAYKDATLKPFSYLVLDFKPSTDEQFRIRTNIFPGEVQYVYILK